jgi:hypothetical protein
MFNNSGCFTEIAPTVNNGFTPAGLSNCTADTRVLIEGTFGIWFKSYDGSREKVNRGRIQLGTAVFLRRPQHLVGGGRGAARAGWNDLHFVPLLLTVACANPTLAVALSFCAGVGIFYCSHGSE